MSHTVALVLDYQSKTDPPVVEITRYIRAWKKYRRQSWGVYGTLACFPLVGVLVAVLMESGPGPAWAVPTFVTYVVALGIQDERRRRFRCPRCGERFYSRLSVHGGKCQHCRLPKWATHNVPRSGESGML